MRIPLLCCKRKTNGQGPEPLRATDGREAVRSRYERLSCTAVPNMLSDV